MSPTSKSRKRKRVAQLRAGRAMPVGAQWWDQVDDRTLAQKFDDWMLSLLSERMAATLFVLACGLLAFLTTGAVSEFDNLRAFENAPSCADSAVTPCRAAVPVTIVAVGKTDGKNATYYVDVVGLSQSWTRIRLRNGSGAWDVARGDVDTAVVELWNGVPVSITAGNATSDTGDAPRETYAETASLALAALAGTAMFGLYWLRRRHYRRSVGERWPEWLALLEPTAFFATVGFIPAAGIGSWMESLIATVAFGGGITLLVGALYAVDSRRARARRT